MPVHDFVDIGDVLGWQFLRGTIVSVDSNTDTCVLHDSSGKAYNALLFWHPNKDATLRDNGAINGAAEGFTADDEVIYMQKIKYSGALSETKVLTGQRSLKVAIVFKNVSSSAEIITRCDNWKAILQQRKAWTQQFYADCGTIINYFNSMVGNNPSDYKMMWVSIAGGVVWPRFFYQADADYFTDWYRRYRSTTLGVEKNKGYQKDMDDLNEMINYFTKMKNFAVYLPSYLKGQYAGGKNASLDDPGHFLDEDSAGENPTFTMIIDCASVPSISQILTPDMELSELDRSVAVSNAIKALWDNMSEQVSPICDGKIYTEPDFISFLWKSRGAIDSDKNFYLMTTDSTMSSSYISGIDNTLTMKISDNETDIYEFPAYVEYLCGYVNITKEDEETHVRKDAVINSTLSIRMKGMDGNQPTSYGLTPVDAVYDPEFPRLIKAYPQFSVEDGSWGKMLYLDVIFSGGGFESFAGKYSTHPIITGIDGDQIIAKTPEQKMVDIEYVNNYINAHFTYTPDDESMGYDYWKFLGQLSSSGDCEDIALTHIQMLLERGWSISDLHLMVGFMEVSYDPKIYDPETSEEIKKKLGHAWVRATLTENSYIYFDSTGLHDFEYFHALYPVDNRIQSGLRWTGLYPDEYDRIYDKTAVPWPHTAFDVPIMTCDVEISKYPIPTTKGDIL